ncbi:MAG: hypothetical protein ACRCT8_15640 [Lacipirellulaceae bacterium]
MALGALIRFAKRAFGAKPTVVEPHLVRIVREHRITSIVELGIESIAETQAMLAAAVEAAQGERVCYTGLDWFDLRPEGLEALSLIATHRALAGSGAAIRLAPGGPTDGLRSEANGLAGTGLILLSRHADESAMAPVWYLTPRMCSPQTVVLERVVDGEGGSPRWLPLPLDEVRRRGGIGGLRRAA